MTICRGEYCYHDREESWWLTSRRSSFHAGLKARSSPGFNTTLELPRLLYKPLGARFSKMSPAYCAGGVQEKFGDSRDVAGIHAGSGNQQIITADGFSLSIRKQRKSKVGLAAQVARFVVRIGTNSYRPDACALKSG